MSKSSVAAASNLASTGTKIPYGEKNTVKFMVPHFPRVSTSNWADEVEEEDVKRQNGQPIMLTPPRDILHPFELAAACATAAPSDEPVQDEDLCESLDEDHESNSNAAGYSNLNCDTSVASIEGDETPVLPWTVLVHTLYKTIDEAYSICEVSSSPQNCAEALSICEVATHDFRALLDRIYKQTNWDKALQQLQQQQQVTGIAPPSIAWEVRVPVSKSPRRRARTPEEGTIGSSSSALLTSEFVRTSVCTGSGGGTSTKTRSWSDVVQSKSLLKSPKKDTTKDSEQEVRKRLDDKHAAATRNRFEIIASRQEKARESDRRTKSAEKRRESTRMEMQSTIASRFERADILREAHMADRTRAAVQDSLKVDEVAFIKSMSAENKKVELERRMIESQQRRLQANESIKRRQEDACERRRTAVLEMQERIEAERVAMLQEMLAKKEEAVTRRNEQLTSTRQQYAETQNARIEAAKERRRQLEEEKQVKLRSKEVKRATTPSDRSDSNNHLLATSPTSPKKPTPASPDRPSSAPASSVASAAAHSPARRKLVLCSGGTVSVSVASAAASPRPSPIFSSSPLKEGTPVGSQKKSVEGVADTREAELLASWKALKRKGRRSRVRQIEQSDIFSGDEFKHGVGVAARRTIKTKSEKFCLDLGRAVSGEHPDIEAASIAAAGLGLSLSSEDDVAHLARLGGITSLIRVIEMHVGTGGEDIDDAFCNRVSVSKLGERCLHSVMSCLDLLIERTPNLASYLAFTGRGCLLIDSLRLLLSADSSQVASVCSVIVSIFGAPATSTRRIQCRVDLCVYAFCSGLLASASKFVIARSQVLASCDAVASAAVSGVLTVVRALVRCTIELPKGLRSSAWEAASAALELSDLCSALPLMSVLILDHSVSNLPSAAPLAAKATVLLSDIAKLDPALVSRHLTAASSLLEFTHVSLRVLSLAVVPTGIQLLSSQPPTNYTANQVEPALLHSILDLLARFFIASGPDTHGNIATSKVARDGPPLLLALCQLHHRYYVTPALQRILFPTILAIVSNHKQLVPIIEDTMSLEMLHAFIKAELARASKVPETFASGAGTVGDGSLFSASQLSNMLQWIQACPESKWAVSGGS